MIADEFIKRYRPFLLGAVLILAVFLVYLPALQAGFIWDDDTMVTGNPLVRSPAGLGGIWFGNTLLDYFPLTYSSLWLEYQLWDANPLGYHFVNILLHACSAVLLWRALKALAVPGAWVAALIFAVHPVNVESVAWIAERKNTLAMLFFALTLWAYQEFENAQADVPTARTWYKLALAAFALALLSKTAVVPLPAVLLLCAWWRRGRITADDLRRTAPFFAMALALGLVTIHFQYHNAIGHDVVQSAGWPGRLVTAGWAVWFYLGKALLPWKLCFVYPRWEVGPRLPLAWLPLAALLILAAVLWFNRRGWGRPVLFALACYVLLLFPILGFLKIYFQRYSLVADHWQYFSLIGVVALVTGISARALRGKCWLGTGLAAVVVAILGWGTWQQCTIYHDNESLWRDTLRKNPDCWMAYGNLGMMYGQNGRYAEAGDCFQNAIRIKPDYVQALCNMGDLASLQGRIGEAIDYYQRALRFQPDYFNGLRCLGIALSATGRPGEAVKEYYQAIQSFPDDPVVLNNLAWILATSPDGRYRNGAEAVRLAGRACDLTQRSIPMYVGTLAAAEAEAGHFPEAVAAAQTAVQTAQDSGQPELAEKNRQLLELYQAGRPYRDPGLTVTNSPAAN